jgi:hypothetical protein
MLGANHRESSDGIASGGKGETSIDRWALLVVGLLAASFAVGVLVDSPQVDAGRADTSPFIEQLDLVGPTGSEEFGKEVAVLTNGNYVVSDPLWDDVALNDVGAVYLYDGATNALISTLTGSQAGDEVGDGGVTVLTNGNFVVRSLLWDNGGVVDAGAATWVNGETGLNDTVKPSNSLVGSKTSDQIGLNFIAALPSGNYVVTSPWWDSAGGTTDVGAVTWADGSIGLSGPVHTLNSLVGVMTDDQVGLGGVTVLANGNYVVNSPFWDNLSKSNAGAITWANGAQGLVDSVSASNSLIGPQTNDGIGFLGGVIPLSNGNYVVGSPYWDNGAAADTGAVTWRDGTMEATGVVGVANSLVGTTAEDFLGLVTALTNGNYVVSSPVWDNAGTADVGAVTWGDGAIGTAGEVGVGNSWFGSNIGDEIGSRGVVALANGNYVVASPQWDNAGTADVGAVTWGNGAIPTASALSAANSLVGSTAGDEVGRGRVEALTNGNYVVRSQLWDNGGAVDAGAVTWGDGAVGVIGAVSTANSLHGSATDDKVGSGGLTALTNGNYTVRSRLWDNGAVVDAGAATWGDGARGIVGAVSSANSLVGSTAGDEVGKGSYALPNGNYVITSWAWNDGGVVDAGAVTWGDGSRGIIGEVTRTNSLVGSTAGDEVGRSGVRELTNGDFAVTSPGWDSGGVVDAGAVTFGLGDFATTGVVSSLNSVIGTPPGAIGRPDRSLTTGRSVVVATEQNRVLLMRLLDGVPDFISVSPARLLDTRSGQSTIDGLFNGAGARAAGSVLELNVAGRGGIATNATAVALSVTAVNTAKPGFVTGYPCNEPRPTSSNLNMIPGRVVPNSVITALDGDGKVCLYTHTGTDLVVDVAGYFPAESTFDIINPARLLDTRPGESTIDGQGLGAGITTASEVTKVQVTGRADIPSNANAVALNLTLTQTTGQMFATIYPCDETRPLASNINATAAATIANSAIAKLAADGSVCIYTLKGAHVIVDVSGWFSDGSDYAPLTPARLLETRAGETTIDGQSQGAGLRPAGTTTPLQVAGRGGAPAVVATVVINVTATGTLANGFITIFPCDQTRPNASNLNHGIGTTVANNVIVKVSNTGTICIYNHAPTQLVADINGQLPV